MAPLVRAEKQRYSLSVIGVQEVQRYLQTVYGLAAARASLEKLGDKLADDSDRQFLAEAIGCVDLGARRATVVMAWLLTVDHLQGFILAHKLADFNQALGGRNDHRGLVIRTKDDFSEIRDDRAFIEILRSARIITRDVQRILDENLGFRNTCAHPTAIAIPENKVVAAIEDLAENVILKYPLR